MANELILDQNLNLDPSHLQLDPLPHRGDHVTMSWYIRSKTVVESHINTLWHPPGQIVDTAQGQLNTLSP